MKEEKNIRKTGLARAYVEKGRESSSKTEVILNEVSLGGVAQGQERTHGVQQMRLFLEFAFQSALDRRRLRRFGAAVVSRMINSGATANSSG